MEGPASVSVIMPVYNEVNAIPDAVRTIDGFMSGYVADYEILLIESGSTDGSGEACDQLAADFSRVRVVHEGAKRGFGSAVRRGHVEATKEVVWMITADLPFPLEVLTVALPLLKDNDCVLSYRSRDPRRVTRRVQSFVYNTLVRATLGIRVYHVNSAFKLFRRDVLPSLRLRSNSWFLDTEMVYRVQEQQLRFVEIPVPLVDRVSGTSSVGSGAPLALARELRMFARENGRLARRSHS